MRKRLSLFVLIPLALFCSESGDNVAGTATDTNSGSIAGLVLSEGRKFQDSVVVSLYSGDTILTKCSVMKTKPTERIVTDRGEFRFDSLPSGTYSIRVSKDSLVVGQELGIALLKNEDKVVNITIVIVINQTFNVTNINNNQNVTVNSFYITGTNGYLDSRSDGKIVATFTDTDTVYVTMEVTTDGQTDTVSVAFVKQTDGTYASLPPETTLPIAIVDGTTVVNSGTGSNSVIVKGHVREETR